MTPSAVSRATRWRTVASETSSSSAILTNDLRPSSTSESTMRWSRSSVMSRATIFAETCAVNTNCVDWHACPQIPSRSGQRPHELYDLAPATDRPGRSLPAAVGCDLRHLGAHVAADCREHDGARRALLRDQSDQDRGLRSGLLSGYGRLPRGARDGGDGGRARPYRSGHRRRP